MKRVLVTGEKGYIAIEFNKWIQKEDNNIQLDFISLRNNDWEKIDFSVYDSVLHLAAIVHKKEKKENEDSYYKINTELTNLLAKKSKDEGVKQFIFMSTMSVYGLETGVIDAETELNPKTYYGKSKKQAEELLLKMSSPDFNIAIIRPPMVYGKKSVGNFSKLLILNGKVRVFPSYSNKRSMIYIKNLLSLIEKIILNKDNGIFTPQNEEYVSTTELMQLIHVYSGKNWLLQMFLIK